MSTFYQAVKLSSKGMLVCRACASSTSCFKSVMPSKFCGLSADYYSPRGNIGREVRVRATHSNNSIRPLNAVGAGKSENINESDIQSAHHHQRRKWVKAFMFMGVADLFKGREASLEYGDDDFGDDIGMSYHSGVADKLATMGIEEY